MIPGLYKVFNERWNEQTTWVQMKEIIGGY